MTAAPPAPDKVHRASITPVQSLDLLSRQEMASLAHTDQQVHQLFRRCALAILSTGSETDDAAAMLERYHDFEIRIVPESRGLEMEIYNAPPQAFVDGEMIRGIRSHLFSALRDIVYVHHKRVNQGRFDLNSGPGITDAVFRILRNADVVKSDAQPQLVVCWGGHSIPRDEYEFTKEVGYELGLRGFDIVTGCGPGAMKGPMKGAAIGHAKQFNSLGRLIGISEPGIIAAEAPNPLVNELVIMPDIEKRLEAFVRLAHGIVVFPGGVGTAEEILYLLGVKCHPDNADIPLPLVFASSEANAPYFEMIDRFLRDVLGDAVARHYRIITGDAIAVARQIKEALAQVGEARIAAKESFSFNWGLSIEEDLQYPFHPTHESMAALTLYRDQPQHCLIAELRRAFSGISAGNVKDFGVRAIRERGPFRLVGDEDIVAGLGTLLHAFVAQGRMRLDARSYTPCFEVAAASA